jgi:hypothetical protein
VEIVAMRLRPTITLARLLVGAAVLFLGTASARAQEIRGTVRSLDKANNRVVLTLDSTHKDLLVRVNANTLVEDDQGHAIELASLSRGTHAVVTNAVVAAKIAIEPLEAGRFARGWLDRRGLLG